MHKLGKKLIIIGISLITVSTFISIHNIYEEEQAGKNSANVLNIMKESIEENIKKNTEEITQQIDNEINAITKKTINVEGYDYISTITIPTLNLELPVMSEYDYDRLKIAPCRYYGSIHTNDLIICAHSYKTHFKNIDKLNQNDLIIITDTDGIKYIYEVLEIEILKPTEVSKMIDNEFDLTLYTCTNDGLNRITIRCNKLNKNI